MIRLEFEEIAALINKSRTTQINLEAAFIIEDGATRYSGEDRVRREAFPFVVIYLHSDAKNEAIAFAARESRKGSRIHIVYPPSLATQPRQLKERASNANEKFSEAAKFFTLREYLMWFITHELEGYIEKLKDLQPPYYTDPPVLVPSGFKRRIPNPLFSFLTDPDPGSGIHEGALGILLAEPGQGKTYLSRHLVSHICHTRKELVPILVDSTQWGSMSRQDLSSIWKTIMHSFRYFEAPIGWIEGNEDSFLRTTLKAGVFRVVFDGFDEYVLRNRGAIPASEVLESLSTLAVGTGARILLTSRTSFWHQTFSQDELDDFIQQTHSFIYELLPFDVEHAKNYFLSRLGTEKQANQATGLYGNLRVGNEELVGRGFVLSLVADLVERDDRGESRPSGKANSLSWLMRALCRREEERQQLPLDAECQVNALQFFAGEISCGESPTTALLDVCLSVVASELDANTRAECISKFTSHPILNKDNQGEHWSFSQPQVKILLLAELLLQKTGDELDQLLTKLRLHSNEQQDLAGMLVDLVRTDAPEPDSLSVLSGLIAVMTNSQIEATTSSRLAAALCLHAIDRFRPKGRQQKERSECLRALVQGDVLRNMHFVGSLAGLELCGLRFDGCTFEHVAFVNCRFDQSTTLTRCQFVGGVPPIRCEGFASAQRVDCKLDADARAILDAVGVSEGKRRYSEADLKNDLKCVLDKFLLRGGTSFRSVQRSHLKKGTIGVSQHGQEVIQEVIHWILEKHEISGVSEEGYHVKDEAREAVQFFAANNVLTGSLKVCYDNLKKKLRL